MTSALAAIWFSVVLISVLSPVMISGSEHQRMPVAAFSTWIWGIGASIALVVSLTSMRSDRGQRSVAAALSAIVGGIWFVATVVSIFGPEMVTGSDPTTIPLPALIAPVVAMLATFVASIVAVVVCRLDARN